MSAITISPSGMRLVRSGVGAASRSVVSVRTSSSTRISSSTRTPESGPGVLHGLAVGPDRVVGPRAAPAGLRLTARGRRALVLLVMLLLVGLVLAGRAVAAGASADAVAVQTYTVAPGETLWGIAARVAGPNEDVRDVVIQLKDLNRMGSADLRAGEQILLPAQG